MALLKYCRHHWVVLAGSASREPYIDSENFPEITFISSKMEILGNEQYVVVGNLNLNGIEREMQFKVTFNGYAYPGEKSICGFEATAQINRHDFQVGGNPLLHSGKQVHGDSIGVFIALRME